MYRVGGKQVVFKKIFYNLSDCLDFFQQTIIGDFQRENEKFVKEKHSKRIGICMFSS